jgi:hypothetical protein
MTSEIEDEAVVTFLSYICHKSLARRLPGRVSNHGTPKYEEMEKVSLIFELRRCSLVYKNSCFGVSAHLTESLYFHANMATWVRRH